MNRGQYQVCSQPKTTAPNNLESPLWKSFLCTLLVIIVICAILLAIILPYKKHENTHRPTDDYYLSSSLEGNGSKSPHEESDKFAKIIQYTYDDPIESTTTKIHQEKEEKLYPPILKALHENAVSTTENINTWSTEKFPTIKYVPTEQFEDQSTFVENENSSVIRFSHNDTEHLVKGENNIIYLTNNTENCNKTPICDNLDCFKSLGKILSLIDFEINPCENFYSYSCGKIDDPHFTDYDPKADVWKRIKESTEKIPQDENKFQKHFKTFYSSCLKYDPGYVEEDLLKSKVKFCPKDESLTPTEAIQDLLKNNFAPIFDVQVDIKKGSPGFHLSIIPGSMDGIFHKSLSESNDCSDCGFNDTNYVDSLNRTLHKLKPFDFEDMENIVKWINETLLPTIATYAPTSEEISAAFENRNSTYLKLSELQQTIPWISWNDLFNQLYVTCTEDTPIEIFFLDRLTEILSLFQNTSDTRTYYNALIAMHAENLHQSFLSDIAKIPNRDDFCLKLSANLMPEIASVLYMDSFPGNAIKKNAVYFKEIFEQISITLSEEIQSRTFPEVKTENISVFLDNLNLITAAQNPPWKNRQFLNDRYSNVLLKEDNFIKNFEQLEMNRRLQRMNLFGADPKIPENIWTFFTTPFETLPVNIPELDRIVLPLGYTMDTQYNSNSSEYLQMSEVGFKLSKILFQYFQKANVKLFEADNSSDSEILTITYKETNFSVNPVILRNEQVIDYLATKLTYSAYQKMVQDEKNDTLSVLNEKSTEQIFFINMAQQLCTKSSKFYKYSNIPAPIEVNSLAGNCRYFSKAFSCEKMPKLEAFRNMVPDSIRQSDEEDDDKISFTTDI